MVEGVIVAPVLVAIFFGATFLRELYLVRGQARFEARRCAWEHAVTGCDTLPSSCSSEAPSLDTAQPDGAPNLAGIARSQVGTGELDPFSDIPVVGSAFQMLFGTTTHSEVQRYVHFPLDHERIGVARGDAVVLCNSRNETVERVAIQFLKELLRELGL